MPTINQPRSPRGDTAANSMSPAAESPAAHHARPTGRRRVMQGLFASVAGAALSPALVASGSSGPGHGSQEVRFDETYRGRRIVGYRRDVTRSGDDAGAWHVTVDGRPLHLMRRADGSWMTTVEHYGSYPTPISAARAAVDELGPTERLRASDAHGHGSDTSTPSGSEGAGREHRSGVHA